MRRFSHWVLLVLLAVLYISIPSKANSEDVDDSFKQEFSFLRGQNPETIGREALIQGYQDLIAKYQADPRTAEAMFLVGVELESTHQNGVKPDHEAAAAWYRKAVARSSPGTPIWTKSRFYLAARLPYLRDEKNENLAFARQLLNEIAEQDQANYVVLAELENAWISQCKRERNLKGVQDHVEKLLKWYDDPDRIPKDPRQKKIVDGFIAGAARVMSETWLTAELPKKDRARHIEQIESDYSHLPGVSQTADRLLNQIERTSEPPLPVEKVHLDPKPKWRWLVFVGINVIGAVVFSLIYKRRPA